MLKSIRKGQSTLEYVIILAAVVGAIIIIAGKVKSSLQETSGNLNEKMGTAITTLGGKLE